MGNGRRKEIERHLTEDELDAKLRDETDPEMIRRLSFVKNLYHGDTLGEAADRVGKSQPTGARWAERWNSSGLDGLAPDYSDGRPPKLNADERQRLQELLEADQPWTTQEIRHLIEEEFDVSYHPNYIYKLLRHFEMHYAKPRPKRPERPENADEILEDRLDESLDEDDGDDPVPDGGYVVGFLTRHGHSRPTTADESGRSTYPK
jgi:transposase